MVAEAATPAETKPASTIPWPTSKQGWFLVVMLTIAYIFSFLDRYVLGLLIEPIKADLGLTDLQISWVVGFAFAVFYASMGIPLGWLVDRKNRTVIVALGVTVWSLATAFSGLATKFWHLFVARMMVGAGEATLSPAAFSMIGDSFPPEKRGKPIGFYSMALSIGAGLASLIGGVVLLWAKETPSITLPLVGEVAPWQATFIAVGLPGLLIAVVFLLMKEPVRRPSTFTVPEVDSEVSDFPKGQFIRGAILFLGTLIALALNTILRLDFPGPAWMWAIIAVALLVYSFREFFLAVRAVEPRGNSFLEALSFVFRNIGAYGGFVSLICVMTIMAYSQSYLPSTFIRTWGWQAENYAFVNGVAILAIGPANVFFAGWLSDRWSQQGKRDAPLKILIIGFLIMVPSGVVPFFVADGTLAYALLCINTVGIGIVSSVGVTGLLLITPAQIRGQVVALYYMAIGMTGLILGPFSVGYLSTEVYGEENIRYAMATVPILFGAIPLLLIPFTIRRFRAQMERVGVSAE